MLLNYDKFQIVYSLFNKYLFTEAKSNMDQFREYVKYDQYLASSTLVDKLTTLITKYSYDDITNDTIKLQLISDGKSSAEADSIMEKVDEYRTYTMTQILPFRDSFHKVCAQSYINKLKNKFSNDPVAFLEGCKSENYIREFSGKLQGRTLDDIDIDSLIKQYDSGVLPSSIDFINECSPSKTGWMKSQVVLVVAAPGVGKSLFMENEAVKMLVEGHSIYYLAMGDLLESDIIVRMASIYKNVPISVVSSDIGTYYKIIKEDFGDRFRFDIVSSGFVSSKEFVDWSLNAMSDRDAFFIDYDSNFLQGNGGGSLYLDGGMTYDELTRLKVAGKFVMVASQPKAQFHNEELLPYSAVGESSRKMHIADVIITMGVNRSSSLRMGKMNLCKNRRGHTAVKSWIGTSDGRFFICSDLLYSRYLVKTNQYSVSYNELEREQSAIDLELLSYNLE